MPTPKPTKIFEVITSSESISEEKFRRHSNNEPTIFGYHGSKLESFHSILNYGLQQHLCKVSARIHIGFVFKKNNFFSFGFHSRLHCMVKVFIYHLNRTSALCLVQRVMDGKNLDAVKAVPVSLFVNLSIIQLI